MIPCLARCEAQEEPGSEAATQMLPLEMSDALGKAVFGSAGWPQQLEFSCSSESAVSLGSDTIAAAFVTLSPGVFAILASQGVP